MFESESNEIKHVLVEGEPGIGKSTWCHYVAQSWASGELWKSFTLVLYIPLRELYRRFQTLAKKGEQLTEIQAWCVVWGLDEIDDDYGKKLKELKVLKNYLEEANADILYLIDGWDEISHDDPDSSLKKLLNKIFSSYCHVILTSRPMVIEYVRQRYVKIQGFTIQERNKFVNDYYSDILLSQEKKEKFICDFTSVLIGISNRNELSMLSYNPIILEMLCWLYLRDRYQAILSSSFLHRTEIYQAIIYELQCRLLKRNDSTTKIDDLPKAEIEVMTIYTMEFLERLAFEAWKNQSIVLPSTLVQEIYSIYYKYFKENNIEKNDLFVHFGLLRACAYKNNFSRKILDVDWEFVHYSIHEYFVARYLLRLIENKVGDSTPVMILFAQLGGQITRLLSRESRVLPFLCGLLNRQNFFYSGFLKDIVEKNESLQIFNQNVITTYVYCIIEMPVSNLLHYDTNLIIPKGDFLFEIWFAVCRLGILYLAKWIVSFNKEVLKARTNLGYSSLHFACESQNVDFLNYILSVMPHDSLNDVNCEGRTALHVAVNFPCLGVVKKLVETNSNLETMDGFGETALLMALREGKLEIAIYLKNNGASLNIVNILGESAYSLIKARKWWDDFSLTESELNEFLYDVDSNLSQQKRFLRNICVEADLDYAEQALSPQNINSVFGEKNDNLLISTVFRGHLEMAKLLIRKGIDVRHSLTNGRTALYYTARKGHIELAKCLLDIAPELLTKKDNCGVDALWVAREFGQFEIVTVFEEFLTNSRHNVPRDDFNNTDNQISYEYQQKASQTNLLLNEPSLISPHIPSMIVNPSCPAHIQTNQYTNCTIILHQENKVAAFNGATVALMSADTDNTQESTSCTLSSTTFSSINCDDKGNNVFFTPQPGDKIMPDKTLAEFNEFIKGASPEEISQHIQKCMKAFCSLECPTELAVREVVLLSLIMKSQDQCLLILNGYLQKLNLLYIKAGYHLSGYAQILCHALQMADHIQLNKALLEQMCCAFITLWSGVNLKNQEPEDINQGLLALQHLLVALERSRTKLSPHWLTKRSDKSEGLLNRLVEVYRKNIKSRTDDHIVQDWSLNVVDQVILRLAARSASTTALESVNHLSDAANCVIMALGSAVSGMATPFFIGTVGVLPAVVGVLWHAGYAAAPWVLYAKEKKFDKKGWYSELSKLNDNVLLAAVYSMQPNVIEAASASHSSTLVNDAYSMLPLTNVLFNIFSLASFKECWQIQAGLADTLQSIVRSTLYKNKEGNETNLNFKQQAEVRAVAFAGLVYLFRQSKEASLRSLILTRLVDLQKTEPSLQEELLATYSQLLNPQTIELGVLRLISIAQPLTLELNKQKKSLATLYLVQLSLQVGRNATALLAQSLMEFITDNADDDARKIVLFVVQALLHIFEKHGDLNIIETLTYKLNDELRDYQKGGDFYNDEPILIDWQQKIWSSVPQQLSDIKEVTEMLLPLWTIYTEKRKGEKYDQYIKRRCTLVRVGKDAIVSDAKTEELMKLTAMLSRSQRELNRDIPPSSDERTYVDDDYVALDIVAGGAAHITGPDFFINAAQGLSNLVKVLAPDEHMFSEPTSTSTSTSTETESSDATPVSSSSSALPPSGLGRFPMGTFPPTSGSSSIRTSSFSSPKPGGQGQE